jgi:hypothetical protein
MSPPDPVTSHHHLLMEGEVQPIITGTAATHGGFQGQTSEVWAAARVRSAPQVAWFFGTFPTVIPRVIIYWDLSRTWTGDFDIVRSLGWLWTLFLDGRTLRVVGNSYIRVNHQNGKPTNMTLNGWFVWECFLGGEKLKPRFFSSNDRGNSCLFFSIHPSLGI